MAIDAVGPYRITHAGPGGLIFGMTAALRGRGADQPGFIGQDHGLDPVP
jgi:hypothetical protein